MTDSDEPMTLSRSVIARICHTANAELCEALGDYSQQPWLDTSDEIRQSAIAGVNNVLADLMAGVPPEQLPRRSHESWVEFRTENGWTYGPEKNPETKTHPCLVRYDDLPEDQKAKDALFVAIVSALAPLAGVGLSAPAPGKPEASAPDWLTAPGGPGLAPMPFRVGTTDPMRYQLAADIMRATRYALRVVSEGGQKPITADKYELLTQAMMVALLGYWTADGRPVEEKA